MKKRQFKKNLPNLKFSELFKFMDGSKNGYKSQYAYYEFLHRINSIDNDSWSFIKHDIV